VIHFIPKEGKNIRKIADPSPCKRRI